MTNERIQRFVATQTMLLSEAMNLIDQNSNGILFVLDEDKRLCGAVSDGDIRRWLLKAGDLYAQIHLLMNRNPKYLLQGDMANTRQYMKKLGIRAMPVVDEQMHIVDLILTRDIEQDEFVPNGGLEDISVVIMAGGKGTRLYPYTKVLPKPLIPIGDIPIVERIIDTFHGFGVKDFLMTVNYRKNMIKSYFAELEKEYDIEFVEEEKPLGTAGSIKLIERKFEAPVFVSNCDSLIKADYSDLLKFHKKSGNAITMVTAMKNDTIPYGVVYAKNNGEIQRIEEKPNRSYLINTGMYVINPEIIDLIPTDTFFHMTHLTEKAMERGLRVGMYPISEDAFLDMGEFTEMKRMEEKLHLR